jgi:DNA-binding NtrC family response regulator
MKKLPPKPTAPVSMDLDIGNRAYRKATQDARDAAAKEALEHYLRGSKGNITHAAEVIGMHRSHFSRLVKRYALLDLAAELRLDAGGTRLGAPPRARKRP